jgi:hypothetical protein
MVNPIPQMVWTTTAAKEAFKFPQIRKEKFYPKLMALRERLL